MKIEVNKYSLSPRWFVAGTKGSYGTETMELTFSEEWEGLSKVITFFPPSGAVTVVYNGEPVTVPYEVMVYDGTCPFGISGFLGTQKLLTVTGEVRVIDTVAVPDGSAVPPTPDQMTQALFYLQEASEAAQDTRTEMAALSEEVEEKMENLSVKADTVWGYLNECEELVQEARAVSEQESGLLAETQATAEEVGDMLTDASARCTAIEELQEEITETLSSALSSCEEAIAAAADAQEIKDAIEEEYGARLHREEEYAAAPTRTARGKVVVADDVSPFTNTPKISLYGKSTQTAVPGTVNGVTNPVLRVCGKNLLPYPYHESQKTMAGVTITANADGSLTLNGTVNDDVSDDYFFLAKINDVAQAPITFRAGQTYRVSLVRPGTMSSVGMRICPPHSFVPTTYLRSSKDPHYTHNYVLYPNSNSSNQTPASDHPIGYVMLEFTSHDIGRIFSNETYYPMIEAVTDDASPIVFESYRAQAATVTGMLHGVNDIHDEIVVDPHAETVKGIRRYGCYTFTGEENWHVIEQSVDTVLALLNIVTDDHAMPNKISDQLCSALPCHMNYLLDEAGAYVSTWDQGIQLFARVPKVTGDVSDFNDVFTAGEKLYYPVATPVTTDLTATATGIALLALHSYAPYTTFDCTADMEVTYPQDTNEVLRKLTEAIVALGGTI